MEATQAARYAELLTLEEKQAARDSELQNEYGATLARLTALREYAERIRQDLIKVQRERRDTRHQLFKLDYPD